MSARKWLNASVSKRVIKNVASSGFTSLQILRSGKLKPFGQILHIYTTWHQHSSFPPIPTQRECPLCEYGQLFSFLHLYSCWFFRLGACRPPSVIPLLWTSYETTSKGPNCPFKTDHGTLKACMKKLTLRLRVVHYINRKLTSPRDLGPIQSQTRTSSVIWNAVGFKSSGQL